MKFKLDECMDVRLAVLLEDAAHDAETVYAEGLSGEPDTVIYSVCTKERQGLITQDMVFSNPFVFSPLGTEGLIVIRNPSQLLGEAEHLVRMTIMKLVEEDPNGCLWVVDRRGSQLGGRGGATRPQ